MLDGEAVVDVSEYTSALKRWWPLIAVASVIGLVLGSVLIGLQSSSYESVATVEVRPLVTQGDDPNLDVNRQVNTTTERAIAGSQRVAERALALLEAAETVGTDDLDDPEVEALAATLVVDTNVARDVVQNVDISIPADSQVLEISVAADSASRSQDLAQSMAHAYLDFRRDEGLAGTELARQQLLAREQELILELDDLSREIAAATSDAQRQSLSYRDVSKREELAGIGSRLANISAISINAGEVLDDAELPEGRAGLPFLAGPMSGLLLGALAGLGVAFMLDRRDDRFRSAPSELTQMDLAPMGSVPVGRGIFRLGTDQAIAELNSEAGEAYRRVQGSLLFNLDQSDKTVVLVTGTNNPHSTTTVAANLATAAARAGRRTLLIGADLRRPSLHDRFGLDNVRGLSDVLSGNVAVDGALQQPPELPNLRIIPAGSPVQQPARLLQSVALGRFLSQVKDGYDLVVVEAPPVLSVADAADLGRLCEGVVLVVEPGRTSRSDVADSVEQLRRVGADVVGSIVAESTPV